jgi:hypothetical protein
MFLNASIPHFYCYLRKEYLYDLRSHHGEFVSVAVFGLASVPTRAIMFHAMTENGAQIARLPISAFVHKADAPTDIPLDCLELWDCFSYDVSVTVFDYLRGLRCRTILKDRRWYLGKYMMTIDWCNSPYAEDPGEGGHKNAHLIALDNGLFAAQPNNRVIWSEPSFVTKPLEENPGYKTNSHVWSCEDKGSKWHASDDDLFFYGIIDESADSEDNVPEKSIVRVSG